MFSGKYIFIVFGLILTCLSAVNSAHADVVMMSYNVRNGIGMDGKRDYERQAKIIKSASPDLVAVQELDRCTRRNQGKDALMELASRTGLHATYAKAIDFDGGEYGIGILSKEKPLKVERHPLPGREESRVLLLAEFKDYYFCCAHLSLNAEDSAASIAIITKLATKSKKPFFIAGDFNLTPDSAQIQQMNFFFKMLNAPRQFTYPADKPNQCIDYIWMYNNPGLKAIQHKNPVTLEEPVASDHRPICVDVGI